MNGDPITGHVLLSFFPIGFLAVNLAANHLADAIPRFPIFTDRLFALIRLEKSSKSLA